MNDDRLAGAVGDWLQATDTPPRDPTGSRLRVVTRAQGTPQAGAWSARLTLLPATPSPATVVALTFGGLLAFLLLLAVVRSGDPTPASAPIGQPSASAIADEGLRVVDRGRSGQVVDSVDGTGARAIDPFIGSRDARRSDPRTTAGPHRGGDAVTLEFRGAALRGRVWTDGTVRVLDDGAGNATELVDQVVVTPDDNVWVARNKAIFALGQKGKHRPPVDAAGKRWRIIDMKARLDGSLEVLTWRALWHFDDGSWERLPTPPEIAHESDLEGYYPERMPDGSVWSSRTRPFTIARWDHDHWTEYPYEEVMPVTSAAVAAPDGFLIDGTDGRTAWVSPSNGPAALAWFDGTRWHEYTTDFIEGVVGRELDMVGDVLVAPDGITWITFWRDGAQRYLVRVKDGEWSSTTILRVSRRAGLDERLYVQALAPAAEDGHVQLYRFGDPFREALLWDGEHAELLEFGPFIARGATSDGTLWGVGRNKDIGLLMRPGG